MKFKMNVLKDYLSVPVCQTHIHTCKLLATVTTTGQLYISRVSAQQSHSLPNSFVFVFFFWTSKMWKKKKRKLALVFLSSKQTSAKTWTWQAHIYVCFGSRNKTSGNLAGFTELFLARTVQLFSGAALCIFTILFFFFFFKTKSCRKITFS